MDPAEQQGGRRVPASFLLTAGSKRQRPDTTTKVLPSKGGSNGSLKAAAASAPAQSVGLAASGLVKAADSKPDQGTQQLEGQGDAASRSTAPDAKPPGPRKLPGSFAAQAPRAPGASNASAAARPPALFNPEDTQVYIDLQQNASLVQFQWFRMLPPRNQPVSHLHAACRARQLKADAAPADYLATSNMAIFWPCWSVQVMCKYGLLIHSCRSPAL